MTTKQWEGIHQDVDVKLTMDHKDLSFGIKLTDKSHAGRTAERVMPVSQLPFDQDELVLDDYLCSIYELLYQDIKNQRGN